MTLAMTLNVIVQSKDNLLKCHRNDVRGKLSVIECHFKKITGQKPMPIKYLENDTPPLPYISLSLDREIYYPPTLFL